MSDALDRANEKRRELAERGELERIDPVEKAKRNPKSLRLAVNGKCWDCQGGDADPAPRWRIGNCEIPDCPLHPARPYQNMLGRPTPKSLIHDEED